MIFKKKKQHSEFKALMHPHMPHINQLAFRLTGNKEDAEDLVQDVLMKIFPRQNDLNKEKGLKAWLSRVIYNTYIDQWRKNKRNPIRVISDIGCTDMDDESLFNEQICRSLNPEQLTSLSEQQQTLTRLLFELKNEHRILIIMHDIEEYTLPELSEILGVTLGTLKSRLHRGRNRLKILLEQENICQVEEVVA